MAKSKRKPVAVAAPAEPGLQLGDVVLDRALAEHALLLVIGDGTHEPAGDPETQSALARFETDKLVRETPAGWELTALGSRRLGDLETALPTEQRLFLETLRAGVQEIVSRYGELLDDPAAFANALIAALEANPYAADAIARALYFVDDDSRARVLAALEANPEPGVFAAMLHAWAPYRYDRPGADPKHALLPHEPWIALLRRGLANAAPEVRLDALRLVFASSVGDDFVDDLVVFADTEHRETLQVIWFALHAASGDRAREARRALETRAELAWVPASLRVQ
ncbi:MAG: hypothetical protein ABI867_00220 [Kofleriaceae bacterium]